MPVPDPNKRLHVRHSSTVTCRWPEPMQWQRAKSTFLLLTWLHSHMDPCVSPWTCANCLAGASLRRGKGVCLAKMEWRISAEPSPLILFIPTTHPWGPDPRSDPPTPYLPTLPLLLPYCFWWTGSLLPASQPAWPTVIELAASLHSLAEVLAQQWCTRSMGGPVLRPAELAFCQWTGTEIVYTWVAVDHNTLGNVNLVNVIHCHNSFSIPSLVLKNTVIHTTLCCCS